MQGILHKPIFTSIDSILRLLIPKIMHFCILPHISISFFFLLAPSTYSVRSGMIRLSDRLIIRSGHNKLYILEIIIDHALEDTKPNDMVVLFRTLQSKATESQGKIIKDVILVFMINKSHDLLQIILGIQLWRSYIQLHLLMMQQALHIPIIKRKRKLTGRIQEVNITHKYSRIITIWIKLEVLANPF